MKKIFHFIAIASIIAAFASCVEDNGRYDYAELPAFYVDTVGLSSQLNITMLQFDDLNITPKLVFDGDKSKLEHSWAIYRKVDGTYAPPGIGGNDAIDLENPSGTLSMEMTYSPNNYYVEYSAHDPVSERTAYMRWAVTVEGTLGAGWLVFHQAGGVADCDLIKTKLLVGSTNEEKVLRNVYSQSNPGKPITSDPVCCGMLSTSATGYNWVTLLWEDGGVRVSTDDMSILLDYGDMFYTAPETLRPQGYYTRLNSYNDAFTWHLGLEYLVNDGGVHINQPGADVRFTDPLAGTGLTYAAAPYTAMGYGWSRFFYDQEGMRFLTSANYTGKADAFTPSTTTPFNLGNIGKKMVYMAEGYGGEYHNYAVFRNPVDDGSRYIYIASFANSSATASLPVGIMDITDAPEIEKAELFAFGKRGPVAFYAVGNKIYQIKYTLDSGVALNDVVTAREFPENETITCMKYMYYRGLDLDERADSKYLFVATWNATTSEGKVYALQTDVSNGTIAATVGEYGGFGKVKDMTFKSM